MIDKDYTTLTLSISVPKGQAEKYQNRLTKIAALTGRHKSTLVKAWIDSAASQIAERLGKKEIEDIALDDITPKL